MANDEVDRRSAILNAAVECFGTLGYYGTSLQRIATMVNLTKPGVLHYVGSKEGLLHAVLDEMYDRETEDVTAGMVCATSVRLSPKCGAGRWRSTPNVPNWCTCSPR